MHIDAMDERGPATQRLMACLGEASRFRLVRALLDGDRCVTDLATEVGLSQSCTTRHLQALERRRIVLGTRTGKRVMYRLRQEEPALRLLLAWALRTEWERAHREEGAIAPRAGGSRADRARAGSRLAPDSPGRRRRARKAPRADPVPRDDRRPPAAEKPALDSDPAPEPTAAPDSWASTPGSTATADLLASAPEPAAATPGRARSSDLEDYLL